MMNTQKLKEELLSLDLFSPFRKQQDCLIVHSLSDTDFSLEIKRFPGLDVNPLNNANLHSDNLQPASFKLSGGYITSGSPEGIFVQYAIRETYGND